MKPIEWMKKSWQTIEQKTVKVINLPAPPTPVNGLLYMPSCWASKTYDKQFDHDDFQVVAMEHCNYGPAVLMYISFNKLITYQDNGLLAADHSTCCATISAIDILTDKNGLHYADEAVLDDLSMIDRSCHPGSHYIVPKAPYLTAFLQYVQAPSHDERNRPITIQYMTPEQGEKLFTYCNFDTNIVLDEYIKRCAIDLNISFFNVAGGLGKWSLQLLRTMRRNQLLMEEYSHEQWQKQSIEGLGNASQENDSTNVRNTETRILQNSICSER